MLGSLKSLLGSKVNKLSGQTDFLEAVCAASALVSAADGDISDAEVDATMKTVAANPVLQSGFNPRQIEQTAEAMLKRAQGGRMGRMGLMREIEQAATDPDKAEAIILAALDVAEADGSISPEEMAVLVKIGSTIHVDVKRLLDA